MFLAILGRFRRFFVAVYLKGVEVGRSTSAAPAAVAAGGTRTGDTIESRIDGECDGWEGETIVKLTNGQIWQQSEYHYHYHYAFMPEVLIYRSGGGYKMKVEGVDQAVGIARVK